MVGEEASSSGQPMPKGHPALPTDRQVSSIPYGAFVVLHCRGVSRQSISRSSYVTAGCIVVALRWPIWLHKLSYTRHSACGTEVG